MLSALQNAIREHRQSGILVDTNLLVLFLLGTFDKRLVTDFKRTQAYSVEDFELLSKLIQQFDKIIATPSVLAEVSNLSGQLKPRRDEFFRFVAKLLSEIFHERLISLVDVVAAP